MPWCPKCGIEYRQDAATCADCGSGLVRSRWVALIRLDAVTAFYSLCAVVAAIVLWAPLFVASTASGSHSQGPIWGFQSAILVFAAAGSFFGHRSVRKLRCLPVAAGWLIPGIVLWHSVPISPDSPWPNHIEQIVKTTSLFAPFLMGAAGTFLGASFRRGILWCRAAVFALAAIGLTVAYSLAITMLNSVYHA